MTKYAQHIANTPQTEQQHPAQQKNNAGGYSFVLDKWKRLDRFLILGSEGGTYYVKERELTRDNAKVIDECIAEDPARTVARIVEISDAGRAPKNDPAIFALAIAAASKNDRARKLALQALPKVCRIGTHLFHFAESVNAMRGWGRGLRDAIGWWYADRSAESLALQLVKYQQRDGWSHRDLLKLAHPDVAALRMHRADGSGPPPVDPAKRAAIAWALGKPIGEPESVKRKRSKARDEVTANYPAGDAAALPRLMVGYDRAQKATSTAEVARLIGEYNLTHEMIPTEHKNSAEVWAALLPRMPMTATIRNLGKMTAEKLIAPLSEASKTVATRLTDPKALREARVHPIALLSALRVYQQGHGERGGLKWAPDQAVIDALDEAFYLAFEAIEPTGKAIMLALDVSGSMSSGSVAGVPGLSPRDVSAAMAMATLRAESQCFVRGFSNRFIELTISKRQRLDDVIRTISNLPFEGTDCSLPMRWAHERAVRDIDAFVIYTDNETYAGLEHPHEALERYRRTSGRNAKLVVCGTTSTGFTIANPDDSGMLDVIGFGSDTPAALAEFIRAE